jgi:hypothetical protein
LIGLFNIIIKIYEGKPKKAIAYKFNIPWNSFNLTGSQAWIETGR